MQNTFENVVGALKDALEKLEKAIQPFPTRKDFEEMTSRVAELSRRIDALEKNGPRRKKKGR